MNKNQYRIVFNARRGIRMAVAETATSQGKSASGESRGAGNAAAGSRTCLLSLAGTMGVALLMQTALLPTNALAQVVADRNAPGNQQATILQTASGITQVNIQTPSAAGVSRNTYSQFDVQKSGVILNNARTDSNTQIGGYVQGNPWLSGASARVILNEVNSAKPSQLNGYVEVAGQRAEVIIANPAGIAVNGGGFLNASGVTLTTGTPVVNGGNLESYRVRSGSVTIDGAGLDTSTADYTNILTRAATLNAGIWAKNLKIVTGLNQIDATNVANPAVIGSAGAGTDAAPAFALDVAQLGGMYAGKIFLMGTEAGLGVRNSGVIGATAGDVSITNNGWLSSSGTVYASGNTSVSTQGNISITGSGLIAAQGDTTLVAQGTGSKVVSEVGATLAAGMDSQGVVSTKGNLNATAAGGITMIGQIASGADTTLGSVDIDLAGATVTAAGTLTTTATQTLRTDGAVVIADHLVLQANGISNVRGQLLQTGTNDMVLAPAHTLDNTNGTIATNSKLTINASTLTNVGGLMRSARDQSVTIATGGSLDNTAGLVHSDAALRVVAPTVINNNTLAQDAQGHATAQGLEGNTVNISATTLANDTGAIRSVDTLVIRSGGVIDNSHGLISAGQLTIQDTATTVAARTLILSNTSGVAVSAQSTTIQAAAITGSGDLQSQGDLSVDLSTDFNNAGNLLANNNTTVTTTGTFNNSGKVKAGKVVQVNSQNLNNAVGAEISAKTTQLAVTNTLTNRGLVDSSNASGTGHTQIHATIVNNLGRGAIYGDSISIAASTLNNDVDGASGSTASGTIATRAGRLDLGVGTLFNNEGGLIFSMTDLGVGGSLDSNGRATGRAQSITNNSATIEAQRALDINTVDLRNTYDSLSYRVDLVSDNGTDAIYQAVAINGINGPGKIISGTTLSLDATGTNLNAKSQIVAGGALNISGGAVDNQALTVVVNNLHRTPVCGGFQIGCALGTGAYSVTVIPTTQVIAVGATEIRANPNTGSAPQRTTTVGSVFSAAVQNTITPTANIAPQATSSIVLPTSSLYRINTTLGTKYLVETDPRFTNNRLWLSSDYMTQSLALDPSVTQKRLGDGFYEQQLINEQITQLTGRRFLGNYSSDQQEYQALMDAGLTYASAYNLRPGIALSAAQVAQLTSDIVWLQQENVTLPDGSITQALVPHVYLALKDGDLTASGALLSGNAVNLATSQLNNSGTIQGRQLVQIDADTVNNLGGKIQAQKVVLNATRDINNVGGTMTAQDLLSVTAGSDLNVSSSTQSSSGGSGNYSFSQSGIDRVAGLYVTNSKGVLLASAGNDMNIIAAQMRSAGDAQLTAGNTVNVNTVQSSQTNNFGAGNADNHLLTSQTREVGSKIAAGGNLQITAGQDVYARAAEIQAQGALQVQAQGNVVLDAGQSSSTFDSATKSSSSGFFSSSTTSTQTLASAATAQVSTLQGKTVSVVADQNLVSVGTQIKGTDSVVVEGKDTSAFYAVNNVFQSTTTTQSSSSFMGINLSKNESTDQLQKSTAIGTTLISTQKVEIGVGNSTTLRGTTVEAPQIAFVQTDPTKAGNLVLGGSTDTTVTSHTEKNETAGLWQEMKGQGKTEQTLNQTSLKGNVSFDNGLKITAQLPQGDLKAQVQALGAQGGLTYLSALANNPNVKWDQVALAHEQWSYSQQGLTGAGAALVAIAIAVCSGGTAAGLAAEMLGEGMAATALGAGMTSLAAQASVAMINNGGDISKTLNQLGSEQSIKNLLTTMVTAGALAGLDNTMGFDSTQTATGQSGAGTLTPNGVATSQAANQFTQNLLKNVTNNVAGAAIDSAINGKPFDEKSLTAALSSGLITAGMAYGANGIGDATTPQNGSPALIDAFTQKVAHAVLGCAAGAATVGNGAGCAPGAVGAVVGEMAAEYATETLKMNKTDAFNFAKVMSATAGVIAGGGGDNAAAVNIAATTGANAAENNYLSHIPKNKAALSEQQQYAAAAAACGPTNPDACDLRDKLVRLSSQRDRDLANACSGATPELCNSKAQEAAAIGNVVRTTEGGYTYANSPTPSQLDVATIGAPTRPDSFQDKASKSTSEAVVLEVGNQAVEAVVRAAFVGGKAILGLGEKTSATEFVGPLSNTGSPSVVGEFSTQGLIRDPLTFPDGVMMVNALERQGLSKQEAIDVAQSFIRSGSTTPIASPLDITDKLVKVVPSGNAPSTTTGYWTKASELEKLMTDPSSLANKLGLPPGMQVDRFDVFQMTPKQGAVVYESKIAPTTVNGVPNATGGAAQTIVVDRSQFTLPIKTGTIVIKE